MAMTVLKAKKSLLASKVSNLVSDTNENLLRVNLSKFFTDLEAEIQKALLEYWSDTMLLQGQINLILAPIHEKHMEYYDLIMKHKLQEFRRAEQQGKRLVKTATKMAMKSAQPVQMKHSPNNLFGTLQYTEDKLANNTFTASQNTLNRVDSNINQILTDGYKSGQGINEVSRQITERFDQLRTWEANRIARTEIHTAQNMGIMNSYESLGVEYTQWVAADDDRTRDSHAEINGEIIPIGGTYSNGLGYPGDPTGPIEEWINCRCSNAPFVMPYGMMAPSFSPFREEDLVEIPTAEPQQLTDEEIEQRLSAEEFKQYEEHKAMIKFSEGLLERGNLSQDQIDFHTRAVQQRKEILNELKNKAKTNKPKPKSKPTKQVVETTGYQLNNNENSSTSTKITEKQFEKVVEHHNKRQDAKLEFGNVIDNTTGNLVHSKDIRGKKHTVKIPTHSNPYSVIHNHTNNNGFSGGDAFSHTGHSKQEVCYATTPKGIWIMRDTEFGRFRKDNNGVTEDYELKDKMNGKYRELCDKYRDKYQEAYDNAKTPEEKKKIHRQLVDETTNSYNNWLLEEFKPGKRRDWLIEIEFIPKEEFKNVKF